MCCSTLGYGTLGSGHCDFPFVQSDTLSGTCHRGCLDAGLGSLQHAVS